MHDCKLQGNLMKQKILHMFWHQDTLAVLEDSYDAKIKATNRIFSIHPANVLWNFEFPSYNTPTIHLNYSEYILEHHFHNN